MLLLTAKFNPNEQKRWICVSICCAIANAKNNFEYIGYLAKITMQIIGRSITLPSIINTCAGNF
jgi:hypothetical protein